MPRTCKAIGEIDLATAPSLMADLRDAINDSDEALVSIDCSDVTFMDSSGFHMLVGATEFAARRGHTLAIRDPSRCCRRLIRICDWDHELFVEQAPRRARRRESLVPSASRFGDRSIETRRVRSLLEDERDAGLDDRKP